MNKKYTYKIFPELKLILIHYIGDILLTDLKDMMNDLTNEPEYSPNYHVVDDFRDCNILVDEDNVEDYVSFLRKIKNAAGNRKVAFLTNKPKQVVLTYLFSNLVQEQSISTQVFSTSEAVLNYLFISRISLEEFEIYLSEIKTQSLTKYLGIKRRSI